MPAWARLFVEAGPLLVFFVANARGDIFVATAVFMAATAVAVVVSFAIERRLPLVPVVTGAFVLIFGGLTVALEDAIFIKLKPTIVNGLFAAVLFGGLVFGRPLMKPLFGALIRMTDAGWHKLSLRWALFFAILAVLNEVIWRNFSTDAWVAFKVFGILPLSVAFSLTQVPLVLRHQTADDPAEAS